MKFNDFAEKLKEIGVLEYQNEAYIFIEELFGASRADILLDKDKEYDSVKLAEIISKRKENIPLQYILGKWHFMGETYKVSPSCLIPRADTEVVVEKALKCLKDGGRVADLCTGSGCIGISILKNNPLSQATLVDISNDALDIAKENAKTLGVYNRCEFILGDATLDILKGEYDLIISNPPYIPTKDIDFLTKEVKNEPKLALDGGKDGFDIIKALLSICPKHLKKDGYLLLEFGYDQGEEMQKMLENKVEENVFSSFELIYDYSKNIRGCVARKK